MSWRTRGEYRGLSEADDAFLDRFNRSWDTKAEGREQLDAMDRRLADLFSAIQSQPNEFKGEMDRDFIRAMVTISKFTIPKKANNYGGWKIWITLRAGERLSIYFDSLDAAIHLYSELEEFSQWFRNT